MQIFILFALLCATRAQDDLFMAELNARTPTTAMFMSVIQDLEPMLRGLQFERFGSWVTGIIVPGSDIDIAIFHKNVLETLLNRLPPEFEQTNIVITRNLRLLELRHTKTGLSIDLKEDIHFEDDPSKDIASLNMDLQRMNFLRKLKFWHKNHMPLKDFGTYKKPYINAFSFTLLGIMYAEEKEECNLKSFIQWLSPKLRYGNIIYAEFRGESQKPRIQIHETRSYDCAYRLYRWKSTKNMFQFVDADSIGLILESLLNMENDFATLQSKPILGNPLLLNSEFIIDFEDVADLCMTINNYGDHAKDFRGMRIWVEESNGWWQMLEISSGGRVDICLCDGMMYIWGFLIEEEETCWGKHFWQPKRIEFHRNGASIGTVQYMRISEETREFLKKQC